MSLTESQNVFAAIHEDALNDVIQAFCRDRPRHLAYGSPAFVPVTTVAATNMSAIAFPGVPGGIEWAVRFSVPHVDLHPRTAALPPELTLGPGQLSLRLGAELCMDCGRRRIDPDQPAHDPAGNPLGLRGPAGVAVLQQVTCCKLEVFAVGHVERVTTSTGQDAIAVAVDAVEIVDIAPSELEAVLECLLLKLLQATLADIRLPLQALRVGAFSLSLTAGPLVEADQVKARGTF